MMFSEAPLNNGRRLFGYLIKFKQNRFFSIIFSRNSGIYSWASLIISLQKIKYLVQNSRSFGFLDKGNPLSSKRCFI